MKSGSSKKPRTQQVSQQPDLMASMAAAGGPELGGELTEEFGTVRSNRRLPPSCHTRCRTKLLAGSPGRRR